MVSLQLDRCSRQFYGFALMFLSACLLLIACDKDNDLDSLPQPIKDIIAQSTDCNCIPYIDRYTWRSEKVYTQTCKGPTCNCITLYYNTAGEKFDLPQNYSNADFVNEADFEKNIWTCGE